MKIERVDSKTVWNGKLFDVVIDTIKADRQLERQYIRTNFKAVVILPVTDDNKVILVKQYRSPANEMLLEFPAGKTEPGEDVPKTAARELAEETGYVAGKLEYLGKAYASPGVSSEMYHFFAATSLVKGDAHPDEDEDTEPLELPFDEFVNWINSGKITDTKTIAVTGLWLMRKK
jgi:ADP-ribose pyrophosphatase